MNKLPFAFPLADDDILRRRATILTVLCAADNGFCAGSCSVNPQADTFTNAESV